MFCQDGASRGTLVATSAQKKKMAECFVNSKGKKREAAFVADVSALQGPESQHVTNYEQTTSATTTTTNPTSMANYIHYSGHTT